MSQRETEQAVLPLPAQAHAQLKATAAHELEQAAHELSHNSSNGHNSNRVFKNLLPLVLTIQ
jgi:hypothetical protein